MQSLRKSCTKNVEFVLVLLLMPHCGCQLVFCLLLLASTEFLLCKQNWLWLMEHLPSSSVAVAQLILGFLSFNVVVTFGLRKRFPKYEGVLLDATKRRRPRHGAARVSSWFLVFGFSRARFGMNCFRS